MQAVVTEPGREIPVLGEYEVVVLGGPSLQARLESGGAYLGRQW